MINVGDAQAERHSGFIDSQIQSSLSRANTHLIRALLISPAQGVGP